MTILYDTHCHLDLLENKENVIEEINRNHIYVMAMTNLPDIYRKEKKVYDSMYIRTCLGFHPELIGEYEWQKDLMWQLLPEARYIGEVGLDAQLPETMNIQKEFLKELFVRCNNLGSKIISIHSRGAVDDVLELLPKRINFIPILHWYTGTTQQLTKAIELGCYCSINLSMIRSSKFRQLIEKVPHDRLLIETDAPFAFSEETYIKTLEMINNQMTDLYGIPIEKLFFNFKDILTK